MIDFLLYFSIFFYSLGFLGLSLNINQMKIELLSYKIELEALKRVKNDK